MFSAFNPSKRTHTPGAVGSRRCGAQGAVEGSNPQPWVTSGFKSIRPRLPRISSVTTSITY